jgi:hypothetical protein
MGWCGPMIWGALESATSSHSGLVGEALEGEEGHLRGGEGRLRAVAFPPKETDPLRVGEARGRCSSVWVVGLREGEVPS